MKCDLHIHTNCSDGIFSPEDIVKLAKDKGLQCIAVTDHDTYVGVERAKVAGEELGVKVISGIEISSVGSCEVHLLGYNMDCHIDGFEQDMARLSAFRDTRNRLMQQKLAEHGIVIDIDSLHNGKGSVGRGDISREMVAKGYVKDIAEAFDKYIGTDKPCYVQTKRLTPVEAIQLILKYGGIPVLAHPKNLRMNKDEFERFLKPLVLAGLGGIEAHYFTHTNDERKMYEHFAKVNNLIITGGSDFHDYTHGVALGKKVFAPSSYTRKILGI